MELITYTEAINILGCKIDTLRHAVSRGDLTRAGRQKRNTFLLREQVRLFEGKKISADALSPGDRAIWERCKREASKIQAPGAGMDEEAINRMIEQKVKAQFLQQEAARLRKEEEAAREKRERLEQENPFLMAV